MLVLHGQRSYRPPAGKLRILWIISHPAILTREELDSYDLIYAGSETLAFLLQPVTSTPVKILRQCTDTSKFHRHGNSDADRSGIIYVANTRGVRRDMGWWASQTAENFQIYGQGWDSLGLGKYVKDQAISNDVLPDLYSQAWLGLNDHWLDMRHVGMINNRIFDCLACGLPVITDSFPELRRLFGDVVLYADSKEEFDEALRLAKSRYHEISGKVREFWRQNGHLYSFDARVEQILKDAELHPREQEAGSRQVEIFSESDGRAVLWQGIQENALHHQYQIKSFESILAETKRELLKANSRLLKANSRLQKANEELEKLRFARFILKLSRYLPALIKRWRASLRRTPRAPGP